MSCSSGSDLDAGLATRNMSAEAQILGYGTKILSSVKMSVNSNDELRKTLGIPDDMSCVCVLLVGHTDTAEFDVITGATPRNDVSEIVTYVK